MKKMNAENEEFGYLRIADIVEKNTGCKIKEHAGYTFCFPVYMTETMEHAGIEALELSVRSSNCMKRIGINTVGDLCKRFQGSKDLSKVRNCGSKSVAEIMDKLFLYNYMSLREERRQEYLSKVVEMNS